MAQNEKKSDNFEADNNNENILELLKKQFSIYEEASKVNRELALDDISFRSGEQWPEAVRREREIEGRPCLTINRMPQFERQVTNDQRQNRPSINVLPVDDFSDLETAKIFKGIIKHIENSSNADVAYDNALTCAVRGGFGFFRVITDYVDTMSFDQEIFIKQIRNQFQVGLDPASKEPDGSDANFGFIYEEIPKEQFKAQYPNAELTSMNDWGSLSNTTNNWVTDRAVRIAEYFYKEFKNVEIVLLSDGQTIKASEAKNLPPEITIIKKRTASVPVIKWCMTNGMEILKKTEWLGKWIPILPVYGDILDVDGKIIYESLIRHSKDSQRMYNYFSSTETETIALAPTAPYLVAEDQIPPQYRAIWETANRKNHAYLPYKPTSLSGQLVGAPQRNVYEPPVGAISNARMQSADELKATTGIYDSAMGAQSRETSGIAIRGRQAQSQTSNFHFTDNLNRTIRHLGRILVDLIPKVYDTPRAVRILGENNEQEIVKINQIFEKNGESLIYNLGVGKYDVVIETGPSYATKRAESLNSMLELTRSYPKVAEVAADLMVKNMDWPGASEISERLKKTLPPGLVEDKEEKKPLPPEIQQQMEQMNQMIEQLTEKLTHSTEIINTKSNELESRERIEFKKLENTLILKQMEMQGVAANAVFVAELESINQRLSLLNIDEPMGDYEQNMNQNAIGQEPALQNENSMVTDDQKTSGQQYMGME